jgi:hypothetical protein
VETCLQACLNRLSMLTQESRSDILQQLFRNWSCDSVIQVNGLAGATVHEISVLKELNLQVMAFLG